MRKKTATSKNIEGKTMNKGLQIYLIKNKLEKDGLKGDLDKIDFEAHVDSNLTYNENLSLILCVVDELNRKP